MIGQSDLQGHWRRQWIMAPGFEDRTTHAHWFQAGERFVDIRIPADLPDVSGARNLAELDAATLAALLRAQGFAGTIAVKDGICTWQRRINWHGWSDEPDAGRMSWSPDGDLIEDGIVTVYREHWRRTPSSNLSVEEVRNGSLHGVLAMDDRYFLIGIGDPNTLSTSRLILDLHDGLLPRDALRRHFTTHYTLGVWEDGIGRVMLSTNALRIGQPALQRDAEGCLTLTMQDYDGHTYRHNLEGYYPRRPV